MKPMVVTWGFIAAISAVLGITVWAKKSVSLTTAGIEKVSETNMKEYMIAILEENDKAQRTVGFSDTDVMEIFEQSSEIM